jgi:hypothetical protein
MSGYGKGLRVLGFPAVFDGTNERHHPPHAGGTAGRWRAIDRVSDRARAQARMLDTLSSALAHATVRLHVMIAGMMQKIADGRLMDEDTIKFCLAASEGSTQGHSSVVATDGPIE